MIQIKMKREASRAEHHKKTFLQPQTFELLKCANASPNVILVCLMGGIVP